MENKGMSIGCLCETTTVCIIVFGSIDVAWIIDKHKYLGRNFSGDLKCCGIAQLITVYHILAWNINYSSMWLKINMRVLNCAPNYSTAVFYYTLVYGLETTPLTSYMSERINIIQQTMLREMVGWICYVEIPERSW